MYYICGIGSNRQLCRALLIAGALLAVRFAVAQEAPQEGSFFNDLFNGLLEGVRRVIQSVVNFLLFIVEFVAGIGVDIWNALIYYGVNPSIYKAGWMFYFTVDFFAFHGAYWWFWILDWALYFLQLPGVWWDALNELVDAGAGAARKLWDSFSLAGIWEWISEQEWLGWVVLLLAAAVAIWFASGWFGALLTIPFAAFLATWFGTIVATLGIAAVNHLLRAITLTVQIGIVVTFGSLITLFFVAYGIREAAYVFSIAAFGDIACAIMPVSSVPDCADWGRWFHASVTGIVYMTAAAEVIAISCFGIFARWAFQRVALNYLANNTLGGIPYARYGFQLG